MNGNGICTSDDPTYTQINFNDLKTASAGLLWGFRTGRFGVGKLLGWDGEISHYAQQVTSQKTTVTLNNQSTKSFNFYVDDYLKVNTYLMAGDLLLRFSSRTLQPYIGFGLGMTFNKTTSPYIYQFYYSGSTTVWRKPLDQLNVGILIRAPLGLRLKLGESISAFLEYRPAINVFMFTRNIDGETDNVILTTKQTIFGMGFGF